MNELYVRVNHLGVKDVVSLFDGGELASTSGGSGGRRRSSNVLCTRRFALFF